MKQVPYRKRHTATQITSIKNKKLLSPTTDHEYVIEFAYLRCELVLALHDICDEFVELCAERVGVLLDPRAALLCCVHDNPLLQLHGVPGQGEGAGSDPVQHHDGEGANNTGALFARGRKQFPTLPNSKRALVAKGNFLRLH